MTDSLTETRLTQALEDAGDLDRARQPGVYALRLRDPGDAASVLVSWQSEFDAPPPDGFVERLTGAAKLLYVGTHAQSMYERLCQHARGHQSSTIMDAWPPMEVYGLWPDAREYDRAATLSSGHTAVWTDGTLL